VSESRLPDFYKVNELASKNVEGSAEGECPLQK